MRLIETENIQDWSDVTAEMIAAPLAKALKLNNRAVMLLSGGSSPALYLKKLASYPLDWKNVILSLVDERFIMPAGEQTNEYFLRKYFLEQGAEACRFVPLLIDVDCQKNIEKLNRNLLLNDLTYNIVVLGMGEDGHTASLFPETDTLDEGIFDPVNLYSMQTAPVAPHERISINLCALEQAEQIIIAFQGDKKKQIFEQAQQKVDKKYPISFVFRKFSEKITVICS